MASIVLSQNLNADLAGLNLQWAVSNMGTIREATMVYYASAAGSQIKSLVIDSSLTTANFSLESGTAYNFQLQLQDNTGKIAYSNVLTLTAPYFLVAPEIKSFVPINNGLIITLANSNNSLAASTDIVEFILRRSDNVLFWIQKAFSPSGIYTLSNTDNAGLVNYKDYTVACLFNPVSNSLYNATSPVSNTMLMTPSDLPMAPVITSFSSVGNASLKLKMNWNAPADFSYYSSNFNVYLQYSSDNGSNWTDIALDANNDPKTYTFEAQLSRGNSYSVKMYYVNQYGKGADSNIMGPVLPTMVPDAIDNLNILAIPGDKQINVSWSAPAFNGQTALTGYRVYLNGVSYSQVLAGVTNILLSDNASKPIINGTTYFVQVSAVNAIGESAKSDGVSVVPSGLLSISSVVVAGTALNINFNPNGSILTNMVALAVPTTPESSEGPFIQTVVLPAVQQLQGNNSVSIPFSKFNSSIVSYVVMATNANGSIYSSNIAGI